MNKKVLGKVAIVILVVCVACAMIVLPTGCGDGGKAIIILPGIMGSNIIDAKTGDPLWAPLEKGFDMWSDTLIADIMAKLDSPEVKALLDFDGPGGAYEWIHKMTIDKDGNSLNENTPQILDKDGNPKYDRCSTYGTGEYYERTYKYLTEKLGDKYSVRMFEYDWRLDNSVNAKKLEDFIADNRYSEVILVGHSMGGVLASTFLARSEANREIVKSFYSLGAPFFGAHKALRVIENPLSLVGDSGLIEKAKGIINKANDDEEAFDTFLGKFMQFAYDLPTIYQLMPYVDMCGAYTAEYPELADMGVITVDGDPIKNYDDFMAFFKERGYVNDRCVNNMIKWQDEQYVEVDGKKVHASKLVDTKYFVGNNLETELCVNFEDGVMTGASFSNLGDGTVPLYSATCGLPLTDERIYEFDGVPHGNLSYDYRCLDKIIELVNQSN